MISIHIDDVTNESPARLTEIGNYLLKVAGAPTVETVPLVIAPAPAAPAPAPAAPAPAAPAPAAPAPAAPAPALGFGQLDSRGLPWDSRIHSETKNKNGDGSWRNRRNCDKDLIATVEAELRAVMSAPVVASAPAVHNTAHTTTAPRPAESYDPAAASASYTEALAMPATPSAAPAADAAPIPPAPAPTIDTPPPPAPSGAVDATVTFPALMQFITPFLTSKTLAQDDITRVCKEFQLKHAGELFHRPDLIEPFKTRITAVIRANGGTV